MKIFILVLFLLTYVFIIALPKVKWIIAGASSVIAVTTCAIWANFSVMTGLSAIKLNVVFMLVGIMLTVYFFSQSNMPNKLAEKLIAKIPNALWALVLLAVLSGVISAFIDNVATVLMLAPIGLAVAKKIKVSPVPVIISIAVASNLQGAATLVGDTTSVMLADFAGMSFADFFFLNGKFSIFWAVEIGALLTVPVLIFIFRKNNKKLQFIPDNVQVKTIVPTILLLTNLVLLIVSSFVLNGVKSDVPFVKFLLENSNGLICLIIGIIAFIFNTCKFKPNVFKEAVNAIDYQTVLFLVFLFVLISTVEHVGIIADISEMFKSVGSTNVFLLYTLIVFGSVIVSAFIDNIPYVATMLPVIKGICLGLPTVSPYLLYFGLLCGATLGGNLTPIGASANVVGIGILNKEGYKVKLKDFLKIGIPFTLVAVLTGYAFIWLVWGM